LNTPEDRGFPALDFFVVFLEPSASLERFLGFWVVVGVSTSWSTSIAEVESVAMGGAEERVEDP